MVVEIMGLMNLTPQEIDNRLKSGIITICVVGLGRIGLPTAAVFAKAGAKVIGVDIDQKVVDTLNSGKCRFVDEPGLDTLLEETVRAGKLHGTTEIKSAVSDSDALIICVPTPVDETKVPDYSSIIKVCKNIGTSLRKDTLVIIESTVGPGTVESLLSPILEKASGLKLGVDFEVASCPERADPGRILANLLKVPRVVGGQSQKATKTVSQLYKSALGVKVVEVSDPKTANAVKLTENLFRDVNIALANEFAILYEKLGIDTIEVIKACSTKYNFMPHYPGAGVGGPCLPSNPYYLMIEGIKVGNIPFMVRLAREINDRMPDHVVTLVTEALNDVHKTVRESKIAILGVAYKPDIHDIQLTPIQRVFKSLQALGAKVTIYDPMFKGEVVFGERIPQNAYDVIEDADCIIFGTAHSELKKLKLTEIAELCDMPAALVDTQNLFDPKKVREAGFAFRGVGRPFLPNLK
jgi:nucleotide sugar dehydrogenase